MACLGFAAEEPRGLGICVASKPRDAAVNETRVMASCAFNTIAQRQRLLAAMRRMGL
jgi:hypothetical protein